MTDDIEKRLREIGERCSKATLSPWRYDPTDGRHNQKVSGPADVINDQGELIASAWFNVWKQGSRSAKSNAEFIAHARDDIPFLLSTIRDLLKEREWQPIESASRKEEVVVLTKEQYIFRAYPMNDGKTWSTVNIETGCGETLIDEYEPTHWRPLDAVFAATERR